VKFFKDLKLGMDKYVLHLDFYIMDMDEVDIVLGYPWIDEWVPLILMCKIIF
jgi:hypothetical protein